MTTFPSDTEASVSVTATATRWNPPWLLGLAGVIPNGNGFFAALPFILRRHGLPMPEIATIVTINFIPSFTFFLWTPIVEIGMSRRHWYIWLLLATSLFEFLALMQPIPQHLPVFMILLIIANLSLFATVGILGPMVRDTIAPNRHSEAGGWIFAGTMSSVGSAGLFIWVAEHGTQWMLATAVAVLGLVPAVAMACAFEPKRAMPPLREKLHTIRKELISGFGKPSIRLGLLIFASPIAAAVLSYLFSGIAVDYRVGGRATAILGSVCWTVAGAVGAILAGRLTKRINPRYGYPIAGIAAGCCGAIMLASPIRPLTYILGTIVYVAIGGMCGAVGVALMIELTASAGDAASTWFAALWSATNLPWTYMQWLDGRGYKFFGVRGMLLVDVLGNSVPAFFLLAYLRHRRVAMLIEPTVSFAADSGCEPVVEDA